MTEFSKIEQRLFKLIIDSHKKAVVILNAVNGGFELVLKRENEAFKLYTQRNKIRVFKTPNTAVKFLLDMGVKKATIYFQ